ncbi:MAG: malonate decarboxylase subunit alpha [Clostridia bacterium]|nr:malonate decarboxylase subunit alpha [Clostridia bacterium]
MAKFITAKEAAKLINDNDVLTFAPDSLVGYPHEVCWAIRDRFLEEGHPADITTLRAAGMGTFADDEYGEGCFCLDGMLKRSISSYMAVCPRMAKRVAENKIQGYMFPMGPILQIFREVSRGFPGVLTKIGLGTFMDPRYGGGKCNELTEREGEDFVEYIPDFRGEEYLFYRAPRMNVALLRGTRSDKNGNISTEKEPIDVEMLQVAQAVKSSGGIVIVQVEEIVDVHDIIPRMIKVPGIYVDYVVKAEDSYNIPQTTGRWTQDDYNYSFLGDEIVELSKETKPMPLDHKKVIARRAAMELKEGDNVNFGIGMPQNIPSVLEECGKVDMVTMISETGVIGGVPAMGRDFGCHWNLEAFTDHGLHFSYFDGGCLDVGVFGLSEVDAHGNMNTSHLNGKVSGIGGFTDISHNAKKVIFMGTFTANGLETSVGNGKITIKKEGKFKKFVRETAKKSFVAEQYLKKHDSALFITERCVIECRKEGLILKEVAPGIDIKADIIDRCDVDLIIPEGGPVQMNEALFTESGFSI